MKASVFALYRSLLFLCAGFLILDSASALVPSLAQGSVVYVDQNAPGPEHNGQTWDTGLLTIQEGVNAATPGGEVWVADGAYIENVVMGSGVAIYGGFLGAEPGGYEDSLDQRDWVNKVATIDGNQSGSCVVMAVDACVDGFTLQNGVGFGTEERHGGGIYCKDLGATGAIANNTITDNTAYDGGGGGIYCMYSSPRVTGNTITGNSAHYGGGGMYCYASSPSVTGNTISGNTAGSGGGISCGSYSSPGVANNTITGNVAGIGGGIYCHGDYTPPTVTCNTIMGNTADSGGGIYCGGSSSSPSVTGNTITGNSAGSGGGVYCEFLASVTDNAIIGNTANQGGGICCCGYSWSSPTVAGNTISRNTARYGAGVYCCGSSSSPSVTGNAITRNTAASYGGGMYCGPSSSPNATGNTVTGNSARYGGGIYCTYSSPTVSNGTVGGNTADHGGGIYCSRSSPVVSGETISGNTADRGGGVYCTFYSSPTVTNSTIGGNMAGLGRALACDSYQQQKPSDILITNSALWNGGGEIWNNDGSQISVTCSDVEGGWSGEGNIDADPMFADADGGDYHLTGGSPCIDAGTNDAAGLPETDWDGEDRIVNGVVDMGADEYVTIHTEAPVPQPGCAGPLFGGSESGFPAWVWFSIPLTPDCLVGSGCADPNTLLGFDSTGKLWYWDRWGKWNQVYRPPFLQWDLAPGNSYLLRLTEPVPNPGYEGLSPFIPWEFEFRLGRQGWTWIGMPGLTELVGDDFMASVRVQYPSDDTGCYRTSQEDYDAIPDNWITWGWPFYDTYLQAPKTFTPYAPFGNRTCYPWIGYRCWVKIGTATDECDPDQVTIIWP